jgi:tRNA(Ile)-lysidine synthase
MYYSPVIPVQSRNNLILGGVVSSLIELPERVSSLIAPLLSPNSTILIGLSGGVDSVVLLHMLDALSSRFSWQLSALHVHHGISQNADKWAEFCTNLCSAHRIPLRIEYVDVAPLRSHGIEAAARKLRHAALARQSCDFVALAHHADDQAETLLLQLLRGSGVRGVSAMPLLAKRVGSPDIMRPLLHVSRQEILDYASAHKLRWIEDESNAEDTHPRNFLRHRVMPVLAETFPAYRDTLSRSARHFAEAANLLDELAKQDAVQTVEGETLAVAALQALSPQRAKNLLRYFLHSLGAPMPQAAQLDDMLRQLCSSRKDANVCVTYGGCDILPRIGQLQIPPPAYPDETTSHSIEPPTNGLHVDVCPASDGLSHTHRGGYWQVRRFRDKVYAFRRLCEFDRNLVLSWHGEDKLNWPALNAWLSFQQSNNHGVSLAKLQRAPVSLRLRQDGETLRPHPNASTRTLKNLLQEKRIPPWYRNRLPLLYCGDELVCVPGVAIAAEYQSDGHEAAISVELQGAPIVKS